MSKAGTTRSPTSSPKQRPSRPTAPRPVPIRTSEYWGHAPSARQGAFLSLPHLEALYGGAAGGGKSDALLMAALQYVDQPHYSALLLRKTYPELSQPGGLMPRAQEWLAKRGPRYRETEHEWRFESGATLSFGYLKTENDRYRYQGAEYDFIRFDELTHYPEEDYRYLISRVRRRLGSQIPPRVRAASNPGGKGHGWVKRRFILKRPDPDDIEDSPERCAARIFIPAKLADNPGIDMHAYLRSLAELDPQTRAQLLDGDWDARPPGPWVYDIRGIERAEQLGRRFDELRRRGELPPPVGGALAAGIDWGIGRTHGLGVWPLPGGGVYVPPAEVAIDRGEPSRISRLILEAMAQFDYPFEEARYDAAGAQQMETFAVTAPADIDIFRVDFNKRKKRTVGYLRGLFSRTAQDEEERIIAISPQNTELLRQLRDLQHNELGEVIKVDDHGPDALIAGVWPIAAEFPDVTRLEIPA